MYLNLQYQEDSTVDRNRQSPASSQRNILEMNKKVQGDNLYAQ